MKVTCPSCGAKYAIADDKVRGRRVKVRCKSCTTPIVVDGAALEADTSAGAMGGDDEATHIHSATGGGGGGAGGAGEWSVNLSDTDQRQMTTEEIIAGWQSGLVTEDAFVWNESMDDWKPVLEVPELASRFFQRASKPVSSRPSASASAPPWQAQAQSPSNGSSPFGASGGGFGFGAAAPAAAAARPAAAARVSGGRAQRGGDLFGGAAHAGSEEDFAQHAAAPGSTPYEESKPTGARNENSVLFSLDALKAGFAPSAAQASPAPSASKAGAIRKSESANLDDLMNLGGGSAANPIFGLGANQALLHAPPPPEPPPPPPEPVAASLMPSIGYAPAPQKSNKTMMIALMAAVAVILVLGVGLAVALSGGDEDKDKVAQTDGDKKTDDKKSSATSEDRVTGDKKDDDKKDDTAGASGETKPDDKTPVTEEDKKRYAEAQAKKKEEEAKAGEEKKEPEPEKPKSSGVSSFNRSAAVSALSSAASAASGCKRPGGPTGTGKAIVTFAPSGNVTSANVTGGSFGGTSVGGCIASVFRRAKIPPFEGDAVTVSKSFTISP